MRCVILAAGYATRLYPLTENFPKPLLPVGGKPILDWLVDDLEGTVRQFTVVTNHRFADAFRSWARDRGNVTVLDDGTTGNDNRLGAVRDMALAAGMPGIRDDALVMAGDNVLTFSLRPFLRFAREKGTSCVMCCREPDPARQKRTAIITVDGTGRITGYEEKPARPAGDLAVPPFYYYRAEDLARVGEALADGCGCDAPGSFAAWLSARVPMHAWPMPGARFDIGDRQSYEAVRDSYAGPADA